MPKPEDTKEEESTQDDTIPGIPQEKVNELVGTARTKGKESGRKALLKELGLDDDMSADDVKALLASATEAADKDKSELEKVQGANAKLQGKLDAATTSAQEAIVRATKILVQASIKEAVAGLEDMKVLPEAVDDVVTFIRADKELAELITVGEDDEIKGASEAVKALLKKKPYLATKRATNGPGTSSLNKRPETDKVEQPSDDGSGPVIRF